MVTALGVPRIWREKRFRLYYLSQGLSLVGSWMQTLTVGWLVYTLTDSPLMLSLAAFIAQMPTLLLHTVVGRLTDSRNRLRMLVTVQWLALAQAVVMAWYCQDLPNILVVLALTLWSGLTSAFELPLRQAAVGCLVDERDDIENVTALNAIQLSFARLAGPVTAGLLIHVFGVSACFLLNALSYLPFIIVLRLTRSGQSKVVLRSDVALGRPYTLWNYLRRRRHLGHLLLLVALLSLTAMPHVTLLPALASDVFGSDPRILGWMAGASGLGGLCATLLLGFVPQLRRSTQNHMGLSSIVCGLCLMALPYSDNLWVSSVLLWLLALLLVVQATLINIILQAEVDEALRGRVLASFSGAVALAPIGGLWMGALASAASCSTALIVAGLLSGAVISPLALCKRCGYTSQRPG